MKVIQEKIKEECIYNNGKKKVLLRTFKTLDGSVKEIPISASVGSSYSTMTLALDSGSNIFYGKEYRDGPEIFVNNFSAGGHEEELSFEDNAHKELKEELGIIQSSISYLGETIVHAYDMSMIKYFIAKDCIFGEQKLEEGENFEIQKCSLKDFEKKIKSGEINCPHTLACYTLAKLKGFID